MRFFVQSLFFGLFVGGCGASGAASTGSGGAGGTTSTTTATTTSTTTGTGGAATTTITSTSFDGGMGGGTTSTSTTTSTSSTTKTNTTTSSASQHGDCDTDADCPGGACVEVTAGGFRVCATPPEKATICGSSLDQCCANMPCPNNEPCFAGPLVPFCAGVMMEPHNQCAVDQCALDQDCAPQQICGVAGALGHQIRACVNVGCKVDADCAAAPGGVCAPVAEPCCGTLAGLYCVYPNGGCRSNADCDVSASCQVSGGVAKCEPGAPVCPA